MNPAKKTGPGKVSLMQKRQFEGWHQALNGILYCTAALVLVLVSGAGIPATAQTYSPGAKCVQIVITSSDSLLEEPAIKMTAEVAVSPAERQKGLMYRTELPPGMLFLFNTPQIISMWMKNTPRSLDILFIGSKGEIINVARDTKPFSLQTISAAAPAIAALEMPAGTTKSLKPGDLVQWTPYFFGCPQK